MVTSLFNNRKVIIATRHGKEQVIAPSLNQKLGLISITTDKIDTDQLGTFSGEVERSLGPLEAARKKCEWAFDASDCDIAIASEGSFGPHPVAGFLPVNEELLVFIDKKYDIEVTVNEISLETNFSSREITTIEELDEFVTQVLFPSHAVIIRTNDFNFLQKGILNQRDLIDAFHTAKKCNKRVIVESDMRAHMNPTRMKVIGKCTEKLIQALLSNCPSCGHPGFITTKIIPGLPCEQCGLPTRAPLKGETQCKKCRFKELIPYPQQRKFQDPMFCDFCNP